MPFESQEDGISDLIDSLSASNTYLPDVQPTNVMMQSIVDDAISMLCRRILAYMNRLPEVYSRIYKNEVIRAREISATQTRYSRLPEVGLPFDGDAQYIRNHARPAELTPAMPIPNGLYAWLKSAFAPFLEFIMIEQRLSMGDSEMQYYANFAGNIPSHFSNESV